MPKIPGNIAGFPEHTNAATLAAFLIDKFVANS